MLAAWRAPVVVRLYRRYIEPTPGASCVRHSSSSDHRAVAVESAVPCGQEARGSVPGIAEHTALAPVDSRISERFRRTRRGNSG